MASENFFLGYDEKIRTSNLGNGFNLFENLRAQLGRCKSWNQQVSLGTEDTFSVSFPEQCAGVMVAV